MSSPRAGIASLLTANGVSMAGTSMSFLAVPWFVLVSTGSAVMTGLLAFAEMLPYVLVQGLGGPLIDRIGARRMSVATDLAAAVAMGSVPFFHAAGLLSLPILVAAVAIAGASRGAGDTAREVLLPQVAGPARLPLDRASGLYDGIHRLAGLVGAPAAGILIAATSAPAVLAVDSATFAISAALIAAFVPVAERAGPGEKAGGGSYAEKLRAGFAHLRQDRLLVAIAAMIIVTNLLDQAYASVLLPVWVRTELDSPVALGALSAAFGVGAVAGNALMAWVGPRLPRRLPFAISFLVCGAPRFIALALASSLTPVLAVVLASGLGAGGLNPALGAVEYERVPRQLQARVLGALGALAWAGIPFGSLVGGGLAGAVGVRPALLACGAAYFLATLAPFVFPVWRRMERVARPGAEEEAATPPGPGSARGETMCERNSGTPH